MQDFNISPVQKSKSLTNELAESLRDEILSGKLKRGEKLPSSKTIEEQAGVSRSVVREAVAQLRAHGLVESRQGAGVFVTGNNPQKAFVIDCVEYESIHNAINILQLRMAVETEIAAKSAVLRSEEQLAEIKRCMVEMEGAIAQDLESADEDLNFHLAIAESSGNPYFSRFIKYIGSAVVPGRSLVTAEMNATERETFFNSIQDEHRDITRAIELGSAEMASAAMKAHLGASVKRHESVAKKYAAVKA
ncbi:MAG: hypothetical protein COA42_04610 [Alteromonadaceae bacterium]|nr:MAG: hypothetical protein COA42_04610 [Alteromonadaceae bacterium]